jgi:4-hydroxy-tetrahydrodipicolinate synthase
MDSPRIDLPNARFDFHSEAYRRVCGVVVARISQLSPAAPEEWLVKDFTPAYGIVPPLLTPFNEDKSIDWDAYERLIEWHIEKGVTGLFVVCGSSEYWQLTDDESVEMAKFAVKVAGDRINILAGSTKSPDDDLERNIAVTKRMWEETGVKGCYLTTPRKLPPEDDIMVEYHMKIHDAVECPVYAYEMPGGTNYKFSPKAFAKIGQGERFIGIKDTTCDLEKVRKKIEAAKGSILIMEANTPNFLESLKLGSVGGINTSANVEPGLFAMVYKLFQKGDLETAAELHKRVVKIDEMMSPGYVMTAKIAVSMMGVPVKRVMRNPSREITSERMGQLREMVNFIEATEKEFAGTV